MLFSLFVSFCACVVVPDANIVLRDVQRGVDLTTSQVRHKITITLANTGSTPISSFLHGVETTAKSHLAWIEATSQESLLGISPLSDTVKGNDHLSFFQISLPNALPPQGSTKIVIRQVLVDVQHPFPKEIAQSEAQLVTYDDNVFYASPYQSQSQKTALRLASAVVESYTQHEPTQRKGQQVVYGPYADVEPYASKKLTVHFENNSPFITADRAITSIEVSHWGNVAVNHKFHLVHAGAKLKGSFSRFDFQRNPAASKSAVRSLHIALPVGAQDFYFRDEIGNISTSAIIQNADRSVTLELVPRFVLFGGWRSSFNIGYNRPLDLALVRDASDHELHMLNVTFYAKWQEAVHTTDYEVEVTLPEGAVDIQLHSPFSVDDMSFDTRFTYLDTSGRPVLRLRKALVVRDHDKPIQISYRFAQQNMLHEPLLLCGVYFALCLAIIVYMRTDLSLAAVTGDSAGSGPGSSLGNVARTAECVARLRDVLERRDRLHAALDAALVKLGKTRNKPSYESDRQAVLDGWDECKRDALRLAAELETLDTSKGTAARQVDAAERQRQSAHLAVAAHEVAARTSGTPDEAHEKKRNELERGLQDADDAIERLAQQLW